VDQTVPSGRALIVDDEFLIAFDLESSMRELGFDVCTVASNERDAIELAKSSRPDVVVMNVYLGGTRAGISARNDVLANVAIIGAALLTAYAADVWPDLIVGLGIFFVNLDAAREVYVAARRERAEAAP
jgi:DNA-binding NarL/FixJ family response regulator